MHLSWRKARACSRILALCMLNIEVRIWLIPDPLNVVFYKGMPPEKIRPELLVHMNMMKRLCRDTWEIDHPANKGASLRYM